MDFLNHFLSLSLSFTFWSRIIHTRKRAKKKGRRRRGGDKKITERKNLSLAHTASSSSLKNYIRICLNSRPLSPSLYLLLLVYYNDSSSSFPNKHNRVHTTSRDQRRVRSSEEREKKRWTATISCSRRNWPSKRRGAVHVASTRSEAVSEFFFFAR